MDGGIKANSGDSIPPKWKCWFREDKEHSAKWREESRDDYEFIAGRQWSAEDRSKLQDEMRPAITFNRSSVVIDAVSGQEIQNRQEVRYIPREEGDAHVNELYSEAARWFDDESEAPDEDSDAFIDALVSGMGWTDTYLDFDEDPEGMPKTERVDPLEMFWDSTCRRSNLRGASRLWRIKEMSVDEAKEQFPDFSRAEIDAGGWVGGSSTKVNENDPENYYADNDDLNDYESNQRKTVKVLHLQYCYYEDFYKVADPLTGSVVEMAKDEFAPLEAKLKKIGVQLQSVKLRRKKYMQAYLGSQVLEHKENAFPNGFTYNCITGKYDRNRGTWYGLVRAMKDPQTWANKWMSQILHIMNSNSSGGWFYESGAFADQRQAEVDMAKPNAMVELTQGALQQGRVSPKQNAQYPQGYQMLTDYAMSAVRDVVGVNLELMGMREATQPGVLEYQRKQAGMSVLATMFNSLKRYRRARGRVLLNYIHEDLSDGRLIMINGDDGKKYVPLRKQANTRFDIIVDDTPSSPNQKEVIWQSMMQILPGIKDMIPPQVMLQLLDYSPIPASVVEKIKQVVKAPNPQEEQQAKAQAQAAMMELQSKQLDVQKTAAEIDKVKSETKENKLETEIDRARLGLAVVQELTAPQSLTHGNPLR